MFNQKKIFITGGTGSFGSAFLKFLITKYKPKKITIFSRDELKQFNLKNENYLKKTKIPVRFLLGDVRDSNRLNFAISDLPDVVIHAAALKQVDTAEYNPTEFINTNIIGAQNLINASLMHNIKKVLALSTDKASSPINLYGSTKLVSDKLFIAANTYSKSTKFSVVRYGNVSFSRGSVMPNFIKQSKLNKFNITHPEMTRFCISLDDAVKFVDFCYKRMIGGEIYVPKLKSYKVLDLAKAINPKAKVNFIGIRPGEKLHEEMISETDSKNTSELNNCYYINPYFRKNKNKAKNLKNGYRSNENKFLSIKEIQKLIVNFYKKSQN